MDAWDSQGYSAIQLAAFKGYENIAELNIKSIVGNDDPAVETSSPIHGGSGTTGTPSKELSD